MDQRLSFGAAAADYDSHRPSYPAEALRWLLGDRPLRVVDLGAGTGLLTRVPGRCTCGGPDRSSG
ncbi:hypothetical protein [Longispora urticae]